MSTSLASHPHISAAADRMSSSAVDAQRKACEINVDVYNMNVVYPQVNLKQSFVIMNGGWPSFGIRKNEWEKGRGGSSSYFTFPLTRTIIDPLASAIGN